jgi:hypothetical protein
MSIKILKFLKFINLIGNSEIWRYFLVSIQRIMGRDIAHVSICVFAELTDQPVDGCDQGRRLEEFANAAQARDVLEVLGQRFPRPQATFIVTFRPYPTITRHYAKLSRFNAALLEPYPFILDAYRSKLVCSLRKSAA